MNNETIVAVYDTEINAQAAVSDLRAANIPESAISVHAGNGSVAEGAPVAATAKHEPSFWSNLFGGQPDHDTAVYDRSVQGGSSVVTVKVPDAQVDHVIQMLEVHHPVDIDDRANSFGLTQTHLTTTAPSASALPAARDPGIMEGSAIQLSEEQLVVGKRLVNRGGTRIRRFVVETPVEEQITLQDERVIVERHAVTDGRPVADADFGDKVIEVTAIAEEVVVGKTARVVEEISLRKEAVDRVETVRDTVRKEDVEIEQLPAETAITGNAAPGTAAPNTAAPGTLRSSAI